MGSIYARQGKSGDAVDWFEKAVKLDDKNAMYHLDLAGALGDEAQQSEQASASRFSRAASSRSSSAPSRSIRISSTRTMV